MHNCTREELGLEENLEQKSRFYPIHQNEVGYTDLYSKKLKCFDEDIEIYGDYNSIKARILKLTFEKCDNETIAEGMTCHSNEEITNFMRRKFIFVLYN